MENNHLDSAKLSYIEENVSMVRAALGIKGRPIAADWQGKVLSIHLQSNRPANFEKLLNNLEATADDLSSFEIIVKIDDTSVEMNRLLEREVAKRRFTIKYIATPLEGGFFNLWSSMNDILKLADPQAYFFVNFNDEMFFKTKGWDTILKRYIGLFPDHVFRLRTSQFRFRNYYDFWECGFSPETSAVTTRKWIEIGGDWNPCLGPDSFQQCVAYYFGYHERFYRDRFIREVPINDILIGGEGAAVGLKGTALEKWMRGAIKAWYTLMSYPIQTEASRRARKLYAYVWAKRYGLNVRLVDDKKKQVIRLVDESNTVLKETFSYKLNRFKLFFNNFIRIFSYYNYGGGGDHVRINKLRCFIKIMDFRFGIMKYFRFMYSRYLRKKVLTYPAKNIKYLSVSVAWPLHSNCREHIVSVPFLEKLKEALIRHSIEFFGAEIHPGYMLLKLSCPTTISLDECIKKIRKVSQQILHDRKSKAHFQLSEEETHYWLNIINKNDYYLYSDKTAEANALKSWELLAKAEQGALV